MALSTQQVLDVREQLLEHYTAVRQESLDLCRPLQTEDYVIQTMPDVSPPKWHLAHTSWFFETFLLSVYEKAFTPFHPQYDYLFNSYYVTHSRPFPRPERGLLSRPTVAEIKKYRESVDEKMAALIMNVSEQHWPEVAFRIVLGINHEQQHQELLLTDIKHIFAHNPLYPAYSDNNSTSCQAPAGLQWIAFEGGLYQIGHEGHGFAYDNEGPQHKVYINAFELGSRLVTNGEYIEFINDGGYRNPVHWLSEGWAKVNNEDWCAPLYWQQRDSEWWHFTLQGLQPVDPDAPVCHVSLYEADAYASWAGQRLPTEFEWEIAGRNQPVTGNLREQKQLKPVSAQPEPGLQQLYGDVWEWTASAYSAWPGYRPAQGSIGEYNGKFMSGQNVLRGGSFATPQDHIRATYRNFFYPPDRWQFSGIRLAQ